ncbi:uncharacterized protein [Polyergus mexicanus]|uniref:uncharacterized protein n=1 Tax=Polyergus mexicanus TaxID=615972 RepID=UPI0038B448F4
MDENHYQQCLNNNNNNIQRNNDDYDDDDNENDDHDFHNPVIEIISEAFNNVDDDKKFKNAIAAYNINPKDIRTLVRTPRQVQVISACGGEYFYLGLDNIIKNMLLRSYQKYINLLINIDGLPLAKSSHASLWPILCSNTINNEVYLVSTFFGDNKPQDSNTFLLPLVNDLIKLISYGYIYNNNVIKIKLSGLICDAKSFVLNIKGHTGFYSCTKCTIKGKYINGRVFFPNASYSLRTDELFVINTYKNFQTGYSILNNIPGFLPISNTPLDYMHLICLGVVKKLILLCIKGPLSIRLSRRTINKISYLLILLRCTTPSDFVRKPRSLKDVKQWKAVEFRNFLLYVRPVVLRYTLKKDMYHHFLTLHTAITILVRPDLCQKEFIDYAEVLLRNFILSFEILYGKQYISHNVHNLLHLCSDVRIFGPLDNFSAFHFENYMMTIKRRLRKNEKLLQQLIKRYSENENFNFLLPKPIYNNQPLYSLKYVHINGPISHDCDNVQLQYLQLSTEKFNINCKNNNNCCLLKNGHYIIILNIVKKYEDIFVIGKDCTYVKNLYELPCKSSEFDIKIVTINSEEIFSYPIKDVIHKAWKIPFTNQTNCRNPTNFLIY